MATQVKIITTKDVIYGTYNKTICFKESFSNDVRKQGSFDRAKATVMGYALTFGTVSAEHLVFEDKEMNDADIFDILEKSHK